MIQETFPRNPPPRSPFRGDIWRLLSLLGAVIIAAQCTGRGSAVQGPKPSHTPTASTAIAAGRFVYSTRGGALWVMDADGSDRHQITHPPTGAVDFNPSFSPDGRWVVFRTTRPDPFPDPNGLGLDGISVVDVTGANLRSIQPSTGGLFAAWSPTGTWIAFTGVQSDEHESIFLMHPDGTGLRNLHAPGECAVWSPDGSKIAYCYQTHGVDGWDVWVMNAEGSHQHPLLGWGGSEYPGPWSPRGDELTISSNKTGVREVYAVRADGSHPRRLTSGSDAEAPFIWLPDGRIVLAVTKAGDSPDSSPDPEWFVMEPDGSHLQPLPQLRGADEVAWTSG
jgi:Tol biopolymer transport system component